LIFDCDTGISITDQKKIAVNINNEYGEKLLDPAIYQPQQPFYCAPPSFVDINNNPVVDPHYDNRVVTYNKDNPLDVESLIDDYGHDDRIFKPYDPLSELIVASASTELEKIGAYGHHSEGLAYCRALAREGYSVDEISLKLRLAFTHCNKMGKEDKSFNLTYLDENYLHNQAMSAWDFTVNAK